MNHCVSIIKHLDKSIYIDIKYISLSNFSGRKHGKGHYSSLFLNDLKLDYFFFIWKFEAFLRWNEVECSMKHAYVTWWQLFTFCYSGIVKEEGRMITRISATADSKRFMWVELTEQTKMCYIKRNNSQKLVYCEKLLL